MAKLSTITTRYPASKFLINLCSLVSTTIIIAAVIELASRSWVPAFDNALIWLRTIDVGTVHTPLVGLYSRMGWDHPGPALFYAMAPVLWITGSRPSALLVGSLLIVMLSTALSLAVVFRRAGFGAGLALAVSLLILVHGLGGRLIDPWTPYIGLLPFACFIVAIWLWSSAMRWMLPIAVVTGSFAVQCHISVAAAVLAMGGAAFCLRIAPGFRRVAAHEIASLAWSGLLLVVLWTPPLLQQLTGKPGNIGHILRYFFGGHTQEPAIGWLVGLKIAASELAPWGSWLGLNNFANPRFVALTTIELLAAPIGLMLLAVALSHYFRDRLMLHLVVIVMVGVLASVYSFAHIHGPIIGYLVDWTRVLVMFCVAAPIMIIVRRSVVLSKPEYRDNVAPALAVILVVLACQSLQAMQSEDPDPMANRIYAKFWPAIERALVPGTKIRVVANGTPFTVSSEGLAVMLIRAGRYPWLQDYGPQGPGAHRVVDGSAVLPTLALTSGAGVQVIARRPNAQLLDSYDPLTPPDRMEAQHLRDTLAQQFRDAGREDLILILDDGQEWLTERAPVGVDKSALRRYMILAGGDQRRAYAVFLFPPSTW